MNRVLLSTNEDQTYLNFFPIVAKAWKKFFNIPVALAFVTNRSEDDPVIVKMRKYGDVHLFKPVDNIPIGNQAKMARFYIAKYYKNEVCMVNDIDTAPLSTGYFHRVLSHRKPNTVLAVGAEVYKNSPDEGKFPMGEITAEGWLFQKVVNPLDLCFKDYILSFKDIRVYDHKEAINTKGEFSDESLMRVLLSKHNIPISHTPRDVDISQYWIDRSWWRIDNNKLKSDKYVLVNFLRPLTHNFNAIKPVIDHIYGDEPYVDIFT
jgi:hypothetical protein